jgi:lactam utilization protein B
MEGFQCHHQMKELCQKKAWGSGAATPPHPPPYLFLTKFSWRSIQQKQEEGITNISYQIGCLHNWINLEDDRHNHNTSKDTTQEEGITNIAYQIGCLHNWRNLEDDRHNHNTSKDTTHRNININHQKIKEERWRKENNNASKFGLIFSFSFSLFFQLLCKFIYV